MYEYQHIYLLQFGQDMTKGKYFLLPLLLSLRTQICFSAFTYISNYSLCITLCQYWRIWGRQKNNDKIDPILSSGIVVYLKEKMGTLEKKQQQNTQYCPQLGSKTVQFRKPGVLPQTSSVRITWDLLEMQILGLYSDPLNEKFRSRPQRSVF